MTDQKLPRAGKVFLEILENDPKARAAWERARARVKAEAQLLRSEAWAECKRERLLAWEAVAESIREGLRHAGKELESRYFKMPRTIEEWEHLALIAEIPLATVQSGKLTAREIHACALAWADRQKIRIALAREINQDPLSAEGNAPAAKKGKHRLTVAPAVPVVPEDRCHPMKKNEIAARILNRPNVKDARPREVEQKLKSCKLREEGNGRYSIILDPAVLSKGEIERLKMVDWPPPPRVR